MCGKTKTTPASFLIRHSTGVPSTGSVQGTNTLLFPWKLHDMLQTVEREGQDNVVSWLPDGKSFKVHDTNTFVTEIMPKHFKQTKYKSFQRQLNLWGFKRITKSNGPDKGAYSHPQFLKGQKSLCRHLCRQNNASGNSSSTGTNSASATAIKKVITKKTVTAPVTTKPRPSPAIVKRTKPTVAKNATVIAQPAMPVEDVTHCSLLEMAIPTMMDLSTNETLFPSFSQGAPQDSSSAKVPATVEDDTALLFEGCQFFLLDELMSEEEWMEQEVKQTIAPPAPATPTVPSYESVSMVTPPSSPPHSQQDDEEPSFDTDSLLPSLCVA